MVTNFRARGFSPLRSCVLAVVIGTTLGSCGSPPLLAIDLNGSWATHTIDGQGISLSVPANWYIGEPDSLPGSFSDLIGSFSNQPLSPPCQTRSNGITCGPPLTSLQPGAMLVEISHDGSPTWTIDSQPGTPTTVSGWQAKVTDQSGVQGGCGGLGGDRTRTEVIAFPDAPDNSFAIDICSRGVADAVGARIMESVAVTPPAT